MSELGESPFYFFNKINKTLIEKQKLNETVNKVLFRKMWKHAMSHDPRELGLKCAFK